MPSTASTSVARKTALPKIAAGKITSEDSKADSAKPAEPAKKRVSRKSGVDSAMQPVERNHLIEVAAYYLAEKRGFHAESTHEDWLQGEREIDAMIAAGKFAV
jgi:hypothetical protein